MLQGLVEFGLRKSRTSPLDQALIQSGMILSAAQSPPPITFPALADAILISVLLQ